MNLQKLEQFLNERGEAGFRLKQIKKAVFQDAVESFDKITSLPKELREELAEKFEILPFSIEAVLGSKNLSSSRMRGSRADKNLDSRRSLSRIAIRGGNDKGSGGNDSSRAFKALLKLKDGRCIETVLMNPVGDVWSVCVSTQVGCAMKCAFCATGKLGFQRNLTPEEIWGQVLFWKQWMRSGLDSCRSLSRTAVRGGNDKGSGGGDDKIENRISNVVYMGMGEPFNNLENVFESIKVLTDKEMFGMAQRGISVSTSGILPGIEKFGEQFPQVNLAVSLHSANDKLRSELMPVNKTYNLEKLADSLKKYFTKSKRQVFVEYILLDGKNDSLAHAKELADYLKTIGYRHLLHVNLIVFNPIGNTKNLDSRLRGNPSERQPDRIILAGFVRADDKKEGGDDKIENGNDKVFQPSSKEQARKFKDFLIKNGISATIRKSMGQDIEGACGQLAGRRAS